MGADWSKNYNIHKIFDEQDNILEKVMKEIDSDKTFGKAINCSVLKDNFDVYLALLKRYPEFNPDGHDLSILFVSDSKYILRYLDIKGHSDNILSTLCSAIYKCGYRKRLDYFQDNINLITQNYQLSDVQLTYIFMALVNWENSLEESSIRVFIEKFIKDNNFHFKCIEEEADYFAMELGDLKFDLFQYLTEHTGAIVNDYVWRWIISMAYVDKIIYLLDKFPNIMPSEIDLGELYLDITAENFDQFCEMFQILKDKGVKIIIDERMSKILYLAKIVHNFVKQ